MVAYAFGSSLVLAASLTALAGWFGVAGSFNSAVFDWPSAPEFGSRALICAAVIAAWRFADRSRNPDTRFTDVFDHFAANVAFVGALAWCGSMPWLLGGLPLVAIMAAAAVRHGLRTGREMFVVYGVVYGAIGICVAAVPRIGDGPPTAAFVLVVVCVAAAALWQLRQRIREPGQVSVWRPSPDEERWLEVAARLRGTLAANLATERTGGWRSAGLFARIALFVLGLVAAALIRLVLGFNHDVMLLVAGVIAAAAAEWLKVGKRLHASGIEEGLCVGGYLLIGFWIAGKVGPASGSPGVRLLVARRHR